MEYRHLWVCLRKLWLGCMAIEILIRSNHQQVNQLSPRLALVIKVRLCLLITAQRYWSQADVWFRIPGSGAAEILDPKKCSLTESPFEVGSSYEETLTIPLTNSHFLKAPGTGFVARPKLFEVVAVWGGPTGHQPFIPGTPKLQHPSLYPRNCKALC